MIIYIDAELKDVESTSLEQSQPFPNGATDREIGLDFATYKLNGVHGTIPMQSIPTTSKQWQPIKPIPTEALKTVIEPEQSRFAVYMPDDSVTRRQLRRALILSGFDLSVIDAAIDGIQDTTQRELFRNDWGNAGTFDRWNPDFLAMVQMLQIDDEMFNQLWALAKSS